MIRLLIAVSLLAQPGAPAAQGLGGIAASTPGITGVHAELPDGRIILSIRADERFPMQSVYKVPIAMAVLDGVAHGALTLAQSVHLRRQDLVPGVHSPIRDAHPDGGIDMTVEELLRSAIVESDGTASDVLFGLAGGGSRITAYVRRIGVQGMNVAATERAMARDPMVQYRNYATPRAAVALLTALRQGKGVTPAHRDLLLRWMTETQTGLKRIRAGVPAGASVADKTGTDATRRGLTRATNDIALVTLPGGRQFAMAVFLKDSRASEQAREAAIAKIAALVSRNVEARR